MKSQPNAVWHWGDSLTSIRQTLSRGGVVAIPTESSYGLAVDPRSEQGVRSIFRIKRRPVHHPLPVIVSSLEQIEALGGRLDDERLQALSAAWPNPLTILVPVSRPLPATAGDRNLGVRIPDHERLRNLLESLGHGLTATSANLSGEGPIFGVDRVRELLSGWDALVIDDGELPGGRPSTVIKLTDRGVAVLRQGSYPLGDVRLLLPGALIEGEISAVDAEILAEESL